MVEYVLANVSNLAKVVHRDEGFGRWAGGCFKGITCCIR